MTRVQRTLLLVSLVFNATVAIGYFATSLCAESARSAEDAARLVGEEFGLDSRQRQAFAELRKEADAGKAELREAMTLAHERLLAELCKPRRDEDMVREREAALAELREAYREFTVRQSDRFLEMLTPAQRRSIGERLGRRGRSRRYDEDFIRQFDADGDGRLNAEECENAIRSVRGRRGRGHRRRDEDERPGHAGRRPGKGARRRSQDGERGGATAEERSSQP